MRVKELVSKINLPARASMGYLGASLVGKAIGLLSTPFFTRLVSEEEYGTLTLYMTVLGGASVICSAFSSGSAIYRGLSKFEGKEDGFIKSALWVSLGFSLLICLLLFAFWGYIGLPRTFFLPISLQILCDTAVGVSMARARYKYRYIEVMAVGIISSALPVILSILILTRYGSTFGVRVYLMLIFSLMITAFQLFRIFRRPSRASKEMERYMLRTALPLLPHSLSVALSGQADKLFVTKLMGAAALAKYAVVHSLGIALQFAVTSLGSALGPWIIRRLDGGEEGRIRGVVNLLFALFCATSLGLCSVAPEAMRLLAPEKYLDALPALFPIAISTPLALISYVTTVSLVHRGRGKYTAVISLTNLLLCVLLNYSLISRLGFLGAGLALLLSQIGALGVGYLLMKPAGLADIFDGGRLLGYFSFSILIGIVTNLLYGDSPMRYILLFIPTVWGIVGLLRCKDLVFERKSIPQKQ